MMRDVANPSSGHTTLKFQMMIWSGLDRLHAILAAAIE